MLNWIRDTWRMIEANKHYLAVGPFHIPWHGVFISIIVVGATVTASFSGSIEFNLSSAAPQITPVILTGSCQTDSETNLPTVSLIWNPSTKVASYSIRRITDTGRWEFIAEKIDGAHTSFDDFSATPNNAYTHQMLLKYKSGNSRYSNMLRILTDQTNCPIASVAPATE